MSIHTYTHSNIHGGVMVSKGEYQSYTREFESHRVPHSYVFVLHLSKKPIYTHSNIYILIGFFV